MHEQYGAPRDGGSIRIRHRPHRGVRARRDHDRVLSRRVDHDESLPRRFVGQPQLLSIEPVTFEYPRERRAMVVSSDGADEGRRGSGSSGRDGLIEPFATRIERGAIGEESLTRAWNPLDGEDYIDVGAAHDGDARLRCGHARGYRAEDLLIRFERIGAPEPRSPTFSDRTNPIPARIRTPPISCGTSRLSPRSNHA